MHAILVWFDVEPQRRADFHEAMMAQAANSLALEPDCHYFDVCTSKDQPNRFFLYELYTDAAAFQTHLDSAHFKSFNEKVTPWVTAKSVESWQRQ
tara:strand:+ start:4374 stop:4658 length:285 start_codon:yes stop_codon:yes gene_type:complete